MAIFDRPPNRVQLEFERRGIKSIDYNQVSVQLLRQLGLTDVLVIPAVVGTEDEGKVLDAATIALPEAAAEPAEETGSTEEDGEEHHGRGGHSRTAGFRTVDWSSK